MYKFHRCIVTAQYNAHYCVIKVEKQAPVFVDLLRQRHRAPIAKLNNAPMVLFDSNSTLFSGLALKTRTA